MSESKFYHFSATGLFYGIGTLVEAVAASKEGGFVWFDFYGTSIDALSNLSFTLPYNPASALTGIGSFGGAVRVYTDGGGYEAKGAIRWYASGSKWYIDYNFIGSNWPSGTKQATGQFFYETT